MRPLTVAVTALFFAVSGETIGQSRPLQGQDQSTGKGSIQQASTDAAREQDPCTLDYQRDETSYEVSVPSADSTDLVSDVRWTVNGEEQVVNQTYVVLDTEGWEAGTYGVTATEIVSGHVMCNLQIVIHPKKPQLERTRYRNPYPKLTALQQQQMQLVEQEKQLAHAKEQLKEYSAKNAKTKDDLRETQEERMLGDNLA